MQVAIVVATRRDTLGGAEGAAIAALGAETTTDLKGAIQACSIPVHCPMTFLCPRGILPLRTEFC
jgi:hypothetical protein